MKKRFNHHQSADKKSGHPCLIRDYINRTDSKLGQLENEVFIFINSDQCSINIRKPIPRQ